MDLAKTFGGNCIGFYRIMANMAIFLGSDRMVEKSKNNFFLKATPIDPMLVIKHFGWGIDIFGAQGSTLRFSGGSRPIKLDWLVQK